MDMGDMGGTSSGAGMPALVDFPKIYWAIVGATIAFATLVNVINIIICRQRFVAYFIISMTHLTVYQIICCEEWTTNTRKTKEHIFRGKCHSYCNHARSCKRNSGPITHLESQRAYASSWEGLSRAL